MKQRLHYLLYSGDLALRPWPTRWSLLPRHVLWARAFTVSHITDPSQMRFSLRGSGFWLLLVCMVDDFDPDLVRHVPECVRPSRKYCSAKKWSNNGSMGGLPSKNFRTTPWKRMVSIGFAHKLRRHGVCYATPCTASLH